MIEGQTVKIKNFRTGLWSTLGVMLNKFAYEFRLKVCEESLGSDETPRQSSHEHFTGI